MSHKLLLSAKLLTEFFLNLILQTSRTCFDLIDILTTLFSLYIIANLLNQF